MMTGNRCLLDTSVIIHCFRNNNKFAEVLDNIGEVYVSVTAVGELCYGAYKSENVAKHLRQMQSFLQNCVILKTDTTTAEIYGNIKAGLARKGKPIRK